MKIIEEVLLVAEETGVPLTVLSELSGLDSSFLCQLKRGAIADVKCGNAERIRKSIKLIRKIKRYIDKKNKE